MPRLFKYLNSFIKIVLIIPFMSMTVSSTHAEETVVSLMPKPGTMVHLSPAFIPAHLEGVTIHQDNVLRFDFLIHKGDDHLNDSQKKEEYSKLIKYFLASLTVPDKDQWVNLSPYEKDRIIESNFGKTEMGQDLLSQDYLLKQITSSLMYPESGLGKKFWDRVYEHAWNKYHTTEIPVNTFNKVWIVPDEAVVYESKNTAYILKSHLKVMLEEDYLSLSKHIRISSHTLASKIIKEILLPELEKEVNEGKNFAMLRQIYSGMILATWYKKALRASLLGQVYADKGKVKGVDRDPKTNEAIYQRYLAAFKKGVFNYIKEVNDTHINQTIPRKYFAGGFGKAGMKLKYVDTQTPGMDAAMKSRFQEVIGQEDKVSVGLDSAMDSIPEGEQLLPEFVDEETRKAVNTSEIDAEFVVPISIIRPMTNLSDQYTHQLDHLANAEKQEFVSYLEGEFRSSFGPRVVAAAIAIARAINLKDSIEADRKLRLKAIEMIKAHEKLLEPNRELKGLMDVRSTSYSDGLDTPAALVLEAWKRGLGTLVIADFYSVDGIEEAIEASRILEGPKIAPAVTVDYSAEISYKNTRGRIVTKNIEFGHIAISFPLDNPNIKEWIDYKQKLDQNPTWQRLRKRPDWHRRKMDLIISRWNQIHSKDGLALTLEQQKQLPPYPRTTQTIVPLLSRLHPDVEPAQMRLAMNDERLYQAGTPGARSLTDVNRIAKYYGGEEFFSMPLADILSFTENEDVGGAVFIRDPADPRTFMRYQDGLEKARRDAGADEQSKSVKYQMSPQEWTNLMRLLKSLLTKYRLQGLQVYTPKHDAEKIFLFEELRRELAQENIQDGYYNNHGIAFVAESNGANLQEQELVYGRGMGIPENWSRESRWQSLQNQWVDARVTRLRLLTEIGNAYRHGLHSVGINNQMQQQIWQGLERWNKTKGLKPVPTPKYYEEIQAEKKREDSRVDEAPERMLFGPSINEIAAQRLTMEQTINDSRILEAIDKFVGQWDRPDERILAFDVDGTLTETGVEIPADVLEYFMAFMKEGVDIVIITGRGPSDLLVEDLIKRIPAKVRHKLHIFARTSALGYGFDMNGNLVNYYRYRLTPKLKMPIFEAIKKIIPEARLEKDDPQGAPTGATIRQFPEDSQISVRLNTVKKDGFTAYTKDEVSALVDKLHQELKYMEGAVHVLGPMGEGHTSYDIDIVLTKKPRGIEYIVRTVHGRNDEIGSSLLYFGDSMTTLGNDREVPKQYSNSVSFWVGRSPFSEADLVGASNIIPVIPPGKDGTISVLHGIAQRIVQKTEQRRRDEAIKSNGGIDFNSKNFNLRIERDDKNMPIPVNPKDMAQLSQISGFIPVILGIKSPSLSEVLQEVDLR